MAKIKKYPPIIQKVGFDFRWSNEKVWKLSIPKKEIRIESLTWHFKIPFLKLGKNPYFLKPTDVIKNPKKFKKEYQRTMRSNLKFPIDIMKNKGRWLILDGLHRLMKAHILGHKKVFVREIPRRLIPKIVK